MNIIFSAKSRTDLLEIGDYIARDNPKRSFSFIEELEKKCFFLADAPFAYPIIASKNGINIRRCVHGNYIILYRVDDTQIIILHIINAARDYGKAQLNA